MAKCECEKEDLINDLRAVVFGKKGLNETVIRLDETVKGVTEAINHNATVQSGLLKFMNESKGRDSNKTTVRWLIGTIITLSLAFVSYLIKFS